MIKGTTKSGFKYMLYDDKLDDYELLETLCEIDRGDVTLVPKMANQLLGEKQMSRLKDHVRNERGSVSATKMMDEISQIFNGVKALKNSQSSPT